MICVICESSEMLQIDEFSSLRLVTSDVRPHWQEVGLNQCPSCLLISKNISGSYRKSLNQVYGNYDLFKESGKIDQEVTSNAGVISRSALLLDHLNKEVLLAQTGRLLDYGCGKGAFVSAFSTLRPDWQLVGTDIDESNRLPVEAIANTTYVAAADGTINGDYDLITLSHVLEHLVDPLGTLQSFINHLRPNGYVFIQVPNLATNPFDLGVVDHCHHFTPDTLKWLIQQAGFSVIVCSTDWVKKEISMVAKVGKERQPLSEEWPLRAVDVNSWLLECQSIFERTFQDDDRLGILGTTNAALWIDEQTKNVAKFFIDESPYRQNKEFYGRSVMAPEKVKSKRVFLPFTGPLSLPIADRLRTWGVESVFNTSPVLNK